MAKDFLIHIVDDDPMILAALESLLGDEFGIELFGSAEDCLARIEEVKPGMILLDISLPGMEGYAFCRLLKERDDTRGISVTFISAHDTLEARLAGYDAGGDDFVVKPFDVAEVRRKIDVSERKYREDLRVREQTQTAEQLSELLMASMNDYVALVSYLGKLAGSSVPSEVADETLILLQNLGIDGAVQVRLRGEELTRSRSGTNLPLETSIMNHLSNMGRIFEFKNRCAVNFDYLTIMVNNMPLSDPEACGRVRDSLSIAAQGADARLKGIEAENENRAKQEGIRVLLQSVALSVDRIKLQQRESRSKVSEIIFQLQEEMMNSFVHLGLTDGQERSLEGLVRRFADHLTEVMDRGAETQQILEGLSGELERLSE